MLNTSQFFVALKIEKGSDDSDISSLKIAARKLNGNRNIGNV